MIAAFDLATHTGACYGDADQPATFGTWKLDETAKHRPYRLLALYKHLHGFLAFFKNRIELVVYEAPLPLTAMMRVTTNEDTIAFLRGAIGVLEMTCASLDLTVEGVHVQDARQSVLGWRRNSSGGNTKRRVLQEVRAIYGVTPANDNEADAFVLWRYSYNRVNPRLALAGVPLFRSAVTTGEHDVKRTEQAKRDR